MSQGTRTGSWGEQAIVVVAVVISHENIESKGWGFR